MLPEADHELYTLPDGTPQWLTWNEALDAGFCPSCGSFVAGIDETELDSDYEDF